MEKKYVLIDGQQRITSFLILLKLIKSELILLEVSLKEKSQKQATDNSELESIIRKKT